MSNAVSGLQRYYLDRIERAPLHCVNAVKGPERLWYPMALRFERVEKRTPAKPAAARPAIEIGRGGASCCGERFE